MTSIRVFMVNHKFRDGHEIFSEVVPVIEDSQAQGRYAIHLQYLFVLFALVMAQYFNGWIGMRSHA